MGTSAVPALIDALVAATTAALPAVTVTDGFQTNLVMGDFLMIGVDDPDKPDAATSAVSRQSWANANYTARDEEGEITCAAYSWNGNADMKAARDSAYGITAAVESVLRANPSLGVSTVLWTSYGTNQSLTQDQTEASASALVVFSVFFRARI